MTIRHLKIFITVADTGKMSAAAEKLYISQPSVSQVLMLSLAVMISLCHADMRLPGYLSWNVSCDGAAIRPYHGRA